MRIHIEPLGDTDPAAIAREIRFVMGGLVPRSESETPMTPTIGRIVHYVSYGTPGGEYPSVCRAAVVAEVTSDPMQVGLVVLNPEGIFFDRAVLHSEEHKGGTWHWPERA